MIRRRGRRTGGGRRRPADRALALALLVALPAPASAEPSDQSDRPTSIELTFSGRVTDLHGDAPAPGEAQAHGCIRYDPRTPRRRRSDALPEGWPRIVDADYLLSEQGAAIFAVEAAGRAHRMTGRIFAGLGRRSLYFVALGEGGEGDKGGDTLSIPQRPSLSLHIVGPREAHALPVAPRLPERPGDLRLERARTMATVRTPPPQGGTWRIEIGVDPASVALGGRTVLTDEAADPRAVALCDPLIARAPARTRG